MNRREALRVLGCAALTMSGAETTVAAAAQAAQGRSRQKQALNRALIAAIRSHDANAVRDLLGRGADANARDLHAKPDRHGTVQPPPVREKPSALLIVFDDAQIETRKGVHHSHKSILRPDPAEIVKALLDGGADPNIYDYDQTFPLLDAVRCRYTASVRLLLQHHAGPNQTWVHGITPLHTAVGNQDILIVKVLLAAGANPNARSAFDDPAHPLSEEIAKLLHTGA